MSLTILLLLLFLSFTISSACTPQELAALISIKNSFARNTFPSRSSKTECCTWKHIHCENKENPTAVTRISFSDDGVTGPDIINLTGTIPPAIGQFPHLQKLTFASLPFLVGQIPPEFAKLKNLRELNIYETNLSGPIPHFFSHFLHLETLNLPYNKFEGFIPPFLGNLVNLSELSVPGNKLTGEIPASLFSKLKGGLAVLQLYGNELTGFIPRSFATINFSFINLSANKLTGDASFLFGKSKTVTDIDLGRNKLSFDLSNVEYGVKTLKWVDISHNEIYGSISNQITETEKLDIFDVSHNKLCGKIPSGGNIMKLPKKFFKFNACLCGAPLAPCKA